MQVPTYLLALRVHGPCFTTPLFFPRIKSFPKSFLDLWLVTVSVFLTNCLNLPFVGWLYLNIYFFLPFISYLNFLNSWPTFLKPVCCVFKLASWCSTRHLLVKSTFGCQQLFKSSTWTLVDPLFDMFFLLFFVFSLLFLFVTEKDRKACFNTKKMISTSNSMRTTHLPVKIHNTCTKSTCCLHNLLPNWKQNFHLKWFLYHGNKVIITFFSTCSLPLFFDLKTWLYFKKNKSKMFIILKIIW